TKWSIRGNVSNAVLNLFDYPLTNDGSLDMSFHDNTVWLDRVRFKGLDTERFKAEDTLFQVGGQANLTSETFGIQARGNANLALLQIFYPSLTTEGTADLTASLTGTFERPNIVGSAQLTDGRIRAEGLPSLSNVNGKI